MIKVKIINKRYIKKKESITAIDSFTYTFSDNKFYCICGLSGSGKSTLLNILTMMESPDSGEVKIDDENINFEDFKRCDSVRKEKLSIVYESNNLLNKETMLENLKLFLNVNDIEFDIDNIFNIMNLLNLKRDLLDKKVSDLSGGEKQRFTILRSLLLNNDYIIMDEPTSNLDYDNAEEIFKILRSLSSKKTIIIATHDEKLALKFADDVLYLEKGNLVNVKEINNEIKENFDIVPFKKVKSKSKNKSILKMMQKNNLLLYFLMCIFAFAFAFGSNMLFSSLINNTNEDNIQQKINEIEYDRFVTVKNGYDDNKIVKIKEKINDDKSFFSYNSEDAYCLTYGNLEFVKMSSLENNFNFGEKIYYGSFNNSKNNSFISYKFATALKEELNIDKYEDLINKEFNINFVDRNEQYIEKKLRIAAILNSKNQKYVNDYDGYFVLSDEFIENLFNENLLSKTYHNYYFSLKNKGFVNFVNAFKNDIKFGKYEINIDDHTYNYLSYCSSLSNSYIDGDQSFNMYINAYKNNLEINLLISIPVTIISITFIILLINSLIYKNIDNIALYRILGLSLKDSYLYNVINLIIPVILGYSLSIPVGYYCLNALGNSMIGTYLINIVSINFVFEFIPLTLFIVTGLILLILFIVLYKTYKNKRNLRL